MCQWRWFLFLKIQAEIRRSASTICCTRGRRRRWLLPGKCQKCCRKLHLLQLCCCCCLCADRRVSHFAAPWRHTRSVLRVAFGHLPVRGVAVFQVCFCGSFYFECRKLTSKFSWFLFQSLILKLTLFESKAPFWGPISLRISALHFRFVTQEGTTTFGIWFFARPQKHTWVFRVAKWRRKKHIMCDLVLRPVNFYDYFELVCDILSEELNKKNEFFLWMMWEPPDVCYIS